MSQTSATPPETEAQRIRRIQEIVKAHRTTNEEKRRACEFVCCGQDMRQFCDALLVKVMLEVELEEEEKTRFQDSDDLSVKSDKSLHDRDTEKTARRQTSSPIQDSPRRKEISFPLAPILSLDSTERLRAVVRKHWEVFQLDNSSEVPARMLEELNWTLSEMIVKAYGGSVQQVSVNVIERAVRPGLTDSFKAALGFTHQAFEPLFKLLSAEVRLSVNSGLNQQQQRTQHSLPEQRLKPMLRYMNEMLYATKDQEPFAAESRRQPDELSNTAQETGFAAESRTWPRIKQKQVKSEEETFERAVGIVMRRPRSELSEAKEELRLWTDLDVYGLLSEVCVRVLRTKDIDELEDFTDELFEELKSANASEWKVNMKPEKRNIKDLAYFVHKELCQEGPESWMNHRAHLDPHYRTVIVDSIRKNLEAPKRRNMARSFFYKFCC